MSVLPFRVALRADASATIGIGHVRRSLALGQALKEAGAEVCLVARSLGVDTAAQAAAVSTEHFALAPGRGSTAALTSRSPYAAWAEVAWENDAEETVATLRLWRPDLVVVDHYAFDASWHRAVRAGLDARIAAIDDLADRPMAVDWLIDHNHSLDHGAKYAGRLAPDTTLLAGPRYALLAPSYASAARLQVHAHVRSIGIFMGGTDSAGMSERSLEACRVDGGFDGEIEIATTAANPHLAELAEACRRWPRTSLRVDAPDLVGFFARHDLQIGAGGGASWERCCIGAPTVALVCADNQREVVEGLSALGVLATPDGNDPLSAASIGAAVTALAADGERRRDMSERARRLVDGLGARRVALRLAAHRLVLRPATLDDAALMLAWRNDPATRSMSHDAEMIAGADHREWLRRTLADPSRMLMMASVGARPVGVIRFDREPDDHARVSLYLDPSLHGLGLGGHAPRTRRALRARTLRTAVTLRGDRARRQRRLATHVSQCRLSAGRRALDPRLREAAPRRNLEMMKIGTREIGPHVRPYLIAEMSGNHNQSLDRALSIVDAAAAAGADAVKLQTYTAETMTLDVTASGFVIEDRDSLWAGRQLFDLYQEAHTPWEWHQPIFERAAKHGLHCFSSPFDDTAVDFLSSLEVPAYKIASFENTDLPLIRKVAGAGKPMIISTGMASAAEIDEAVRTARAAGCQDIVLLKCTSTYPATPENTNLRTIANMRETFGCEIGLSDHTMGTGVAVAAVAFGASVIEKHFTLRRADGGVDSSFSLEPGEFAQLRIESERAWQSLGHVAYGGTAAEEKSRAFRRSIYVAKDLRAGDVLTRENLRCVRPGFGLAPKFYDLLLGRRVNADVVAGTPMDWPLLG